MANNLGGDVTKFTTRLDKVLATETKTSFLNINDAFLGEFSGVGEVKLPTVVVQGLGDYDRANGFPSGDASVTWQAYKLRYDRGRGFSIDDMDDEEHLRLVSANVMGEFARTQVVPEVDALRFALLAQGATQDGTVSANISTAENALKAVLGAEEYFEDLGFDVSGLVLNLTASMKSLLRQAQPWRIGQGETPETRFETFDGMRLNVIPTARFYTAIDLLDGTTAESGTEGQEGYTASELAGGYAPASGAKGINFMIVGPGAATGIMKHEKLRYFSPDVNQARDAHLWQYRLFHDLLIYEHKKELIYCHKKAS